MIDQQIAHRIRTIINKYLDKKEYEVFLFGSRTTGQHAPFSDVDIGITGNHPLSGSVLQHIKGDLEDSDIPYRVDVVDFSTVGSRFKRTALQHKQIIQ